MPPNPETTPVQANEDPALDKIPISDYLIRGGAVVLTLLQATAKFSPVPHLSDAAGLALSLVRIAETVRENKEGFKGLADDATDRVAAFQRAYEGAEDRDNWLKSKDMQKATEDFKLCLRSVEKLGKKMNKRGRILRILFHAIDASTIKKYRQQLTSATELFQLATSLKVQDLLAQLLKKTDDLQTDLTAALDAGGAVQPSALEAMETEQRARERETEDVHAENVIFSAVAIGDDAMADAVNGGPPGESTIDGSTLPRQGDRQSSTDFSPPLPLGMQEAPPQRVYTKNISHSSVAIGRRARSTAYNGR